MVRTHVRRRPSFQEMEAPILGALPNKPLQTDERRVWVWRFRKLIFRAARG